MISCKINGYENYELFRDGSVYSHITKRILKQNDSKGYKYYIFVSNKKNKVHKVHRLVAEYFIPNPDKLPIVDHINQIKDDNRIENLRWASHSDNTLNTTRHDKPLKNICKRKNGFQISFLRNKLLYSKCCKTEEQAILQRDLMLSMWS